MAGDTLHWQFQHRRKIADKILLTSTDDQTDVLTVKSANHRIYIQKISISITTYSSVTWTLRDDADTPVPIAILSIPATQATTFGDQGTVVWDFGPTGVPLTLGKNLDLELSATGAAGVVHVEGYEVTVGPVAAATTN